MNIWLIMTQHDGGHVVWGTRDRWTIYLIALPRGRSRWSELSGVVILWWTHGFLFSSSCWILLNYLFEKRCRLMRIVLNKLRCPLHCCSSYNARLPYDLKNARLTIWKWMVIQFLTYLTLEEGVMPLTPNYFLYLILDCLYILSASAPFFNAHEVQLRRPTTHSYSVLRVPCPSSWASIPVDSHRLDAFAAILVFRSILLPTACWPWVDCFQQCP